MEEEECLEAEEAEEEEPLEEPWNKKRNNTGKTS